MLGGGQDAESEAKQGELEGADDPINMLLAEKAELDAKLKQLGAVASTDKWCISQAAKSEAKHGELESAENPINTKGCERECALAEGTLQN
eukprot:15286482-Alexandrium_andersonii.AAC.1